MVANIHSLPPETLRKVIQAICRLKPDARPEEVWVRYHTLRAAALVCSAWTIITQEELWTDVVLREDQKVRAFTREAHRFPVQRLEYVALGKFEEDGSMVEVEPVLEELLGAVRGVEKLVVMHDMARPEEDFNLDWISHAGFTGESLLGCWRSLDIDLTGLADLKHLLIRDLFLVEAATSCRLPFALMTLELVYLGSEATSSIDLLFTPSLTSLHLTESEIDDAHKPALIALAPQLTSLSLVFPHEETDMASTISALLKGCTRLRHLTTNTFGIEFLRSLPITLVSWNRENSFERNPDGYGMNDLVSWIEYGVPGMPALKRLSIPGEEYSQDSVDVCKEKGIRLDSS